MSIEEDFIVEVVALFRARFAQRPDLHVMIGVGGIDNNSEWLMGGCCDASREAVIEALNDPTEPAKRMFES